MYIPCGKVEALLPTTRMVCVLLQQASSSIFIFTTRVLY
ncbi:hypothetical protein APHWI1_1506 [Anaplasma phagocytophilum str. ApWI1]|uniref:Uncharacterized protein n=1 Tax=Anaplasma phagocytophilum str. ApWI1 TaxID=1359155 RepID=A0A0F3PZN9_ANAPH|nr:hypothetical protein APHWEB_0012 [Anaplasma phagocytophilum str. Webster]KJV83118.1 hypothetical protein APHHGE2_0726 [Anaplasma phagocytophilum str. HGE2]KJV84644.1 hypothetical protein APHWI1_1506 [Anaplasma phagocytophilum str. ApWI1]KJV99047.1 hypothetical protein OTSANNIE_0702 [Anaplasma phagocytophilum str. Annie]